MKNENTVEGEGSELKGIITQKKNKCIVFFDPQSLYKNSIPPCSSVAV